MGYTEEDRLRMTYPPNQATQNTSTTKITRITATPQRLQFDLQTFLIGGIAGAFVTLLFIYGVAPEAFRWGAAKIRAKY